MEVEQPAPVEAEPGGLIARFPGVLREWLRPIAQRQEGVGGRRIIVRTSGSTLLRRIGRSITELPGMCQRVSLGKAVVSLHSLPDLIVGRPS
jgi:hypothetical protein